MKKILYLAELKPGGKFGGSVCEDRNLKVLKSTFDVDEVGIYAPGRGIIKKIFDLLTSKVPTLYSQKEVNRIKIAIKNSDADIIFIETSKMGYFAKYAKKQNKKVISFLHNCEYTLYGTSRGKLYTPFIKKQEMLTLKYSDCIIYLNERDKHTFSKIYKKVINNKTNAIIPITMEDQLNEQDIARLQSKTIDKKNGLFFGSLFPPNYNGVKWFVENVADHINANITIVGLHFEKCKELERKNVKVVGTVDNLKDYIINAGFIISPIFEGSGMKVKTCESIMYGKKLFATKEALEGYVTGDILQQYNSKEDFITGINQYIENNDDAFNQSVRHLFLDNYSNNYAKTKIKEIIDAI